VLSSDWGAPSTATLKRIPDLRAFQFWDKDRLLSKSMGEHDQKSIVWDHIAVYPAGSTWSEHPPEALYRGCPVVRVAGFAHAALERALQDAAKQAVRYE